MNPLLRPATRISRLVTKDLTFPDLRDQAQRDQGDDRERELEWRRGALAREKRGPLAIDRLKPPMEIRR